MQNMNQLSKQAIKNIGQLGWRNLSVNAQTPEWIIKVEAFTIITKQIAELSYKFTNKTEVTDK